MEILSDAIPATTERVTNFGWSSSTSTPFSADMAPSDFHLFEYLKDGLRGQHFYDNKAVINAVK